MGKLQRKAGTSYKLLTDVTVVQISGEGASTLASPTYKTTTEDGYNQQCKDYADKVKRTTLAANARK